MTLEQLVTDLATSQRLRDAGFPQDTALVWIKTAWGLHVVENGDPINRSFTLCSAWTAGELEEWLLCHDCDNILITNESADGENAVGIRCNHSDGRDFEAHEATEIEAKAALVLEVAR